MIVAKIFATLVVLALLAVVLVASGMDDRDPNKAIYGGLSLIVLFCSIAGSLIALVWEV